MMKGRYNIAELPSNAGEMIDNVFQGETVFSEEFSDVLSKLTLTVGTPIKNANGDILGAVLLHSPVEGTTTAVNQGFIILGISCSLHYSGICPSILLHYSFNHFQNEKTALRLSLW